MNTHYVITLPRLQKVKFSLQLSKVDKCIARTLTQTEIRQSKEWIEYVLARIEVQYFHSLKI